MNKKINNKGFSLIELIIVIAIMAVLIGVLGPTLYKYVQKSKEATDITNLDTCVSVVQAAYAEEGFSSAVVIKKSSTGVFYSEDSNAQNALQDAGANKTAVKGPWTTIQATINTDGTVTYSGAGGKYYKSKSDGTGFEQITSGGGGETE